ncbi:hypothetical protein TYRP_003051 [Tyrophagus putrescentiae]|nr:hypothetical protein TYRP_003051 [Tyrophagus putrescentiae]
MAEPVPETAAKSAFTTTEKSSVSKPDVEKAAKVDAKILEIVEITSETDAKTASTTTEEPSVSKPDDENVAEVAEFKVPDNIEEQAKVLDTAQPLLTALHDVVRINDNLVHYIVQMGEGDKSRNQVTIPSNQISDQLSIENQRRLWQLLTKDWNNMALIYLLASLNIAHAEFLLPNSIVDGPDVQKLKSLLKYAINSYDRKNKDNSIIIIKGENDPNQSLLNYTGQAAQVIDRVLDLVSFVEKDIGLCDNLPKPVFNFFDSSERGSGAITKVTDRRSVVLSTGTAVFQYRVHFEKDTEAENSTTILESDRWLFAWKLVDLGYRRLIEQWEKAAAANISKTRTLTTGTEKPSATDSKVSALAPETAAAAKKSATITTEIIFVGEADDDDEEEEENAEVVEIAADADKVADNIEEQQVEDALVQDVPPNDQPLLTTVDEVVLINDTQLVHYIVQMGEGDQSGRFTIPSDKTSELLSIENQRRLWQLLTKHWNSMAVIFLLGSLRAYRVSRPHQQPLLQPQPQPNNIQNKAHDQILRYTELAAPIGVHVAALVDFVVKDIGFCNHLPPPGTGSVLKAKGKGKEKRKEEENSVIPEHDRWLFAWKLVDLGYRHLIEQWEEEKNGSRPPPGNTEETAEAWEEALAKAMKWRYPLGQRRVPNESLDDLVRRFLAVAFTPQHGALYWKLLECPRAELECIRVEFKASAFEGRHEAEYIVEFDHGQMLLMPKSHMSKMSKANREIMQEIIDSVYNPASEAEEEIEMITIDD